MITYDEMSPIFHALAHETRREMLDILAMQPGCSVGEMAQQFDVSRIAVMNHLAVLEKAGLVISQKEGRTRRLFINAAPIRMIQDRWLNQHSAQWADRINAIKYAAEAANREGDNE